MSLSDEEGSAQITSTTDNIEDIRVVNAYSQADQGDDEVDAEVAALNVQNVIQGELDENNVLHVEHVDLQTEEEVGIAIRAMEPDQSNISPGFEEEEDGDDTERGSDVVEMMETSGSQEEEGLELGAEAANCTDQLMQAAAATDQQAQAVEAAGLDAATLQSLIASGQLVDANGQPIQIIALAGSPEQEQMGGSKMWQLVSNPGVEGGVAVVAVSPPEENKVQEEESVNVLQNKQQFVVSSQSSTSNPDLGSLMLPPQTNKQTLPPGCPEWAARLRDCEKIGDFYRGWTETEVELDLLLTYHKQQTGSMWGTRQSPSAGKPSTRLMWKSQYVPFDGIPFVNAGSRAIVMECQYGPRRKGGFSVKKHVEDLRNTFRQTCPARIYIKRVRKFPEFQVPCTQDKKSLKMAMDKAFYMLKEKGLSTPGLGHERWYVQLPTEKAHEFHDMDAPHTSTAASVQASLSKASLGSIGEIETVRRSSRLNPSVSQKIRGMVAGGETRLYVIRKALRRFVEKELYKDYVPEKHNLQYFPTVNDLQNHIHQAIKDIEAGILPITAQTVNVEVVTSGDPNMSDQMWSGGGGGDTPHAETVTVTLTQKPGEEGQHVISRVETKLSDGSTRVSNSLTPETAKLLAKLHPNMFPPETLLELQQNKPILPAAGDHTAPGTSVLTGPTHGLTLLHQQIATTSAEQAAVDGVLASTPGGGVILPSGDIHQGQNGIYTVIPSENSSLLFSNPVANTTADISMSSAGTGLGTETIVTAVEETVGLGGQATTATTVHNLQLQAAGGETSTAAATLISHEELQAIQAQSLIDENSVAAEGLVVAEGMPGVSGMVVTQTEGGGLVLVDTEGMTLKLEQGTEALTATDAGLDPATTGHFQVQNVLSTEMGITVDPSQLAALGIVPDQIEAAPIKLEPTVEKHDDTEEGEVVEEAS